LPQRLEIKMSEFKWYRKAALQAMAPYEPGEDLSDVSVSAEDTPEEGGMIAYNAANPNDKWYVSKEFFEANYELAVPTNAMSFGDAVTALKAGEKVARAGWNGKGMWLELVTPDEYLVNKHNIPFAARDAQASSLLPFIMMKTADDKYAPWSASQTDVLAEDWSIL
jgi:hypothetical protein